MYGMHGVHGMRTYTTPGTPAAKGKPPILPMGDGGIFWEKFGIFLYYEVYVHKVFAPGPSTAQKPYVLQCWLVKYSYIHVTERYRVRVGGITPLKLPISLNMTPQTAACIARKGAPRPQQLPGAPEKQKKTSNIFSGDGGWEDGRFHFAAALPQGQFL